MVFYLYIIYVLFKSILFTFVSFSSSDRVTIFATIVQTFVSLLIFIVPFVQDKLYRKREKRVQEIKDKEAEEKKFRDKLSQLIEFSMAYPHIEDDRYCESWLEHKNSTVGNDEVYNKLLRYDAYCCLVFNFISEVNSSKFFGSSKVLSNFGIKELIGRHWRWFESPLGSTNQNDCYDNSMKELVDSVKPKTLISYE